MVPGVGRCPRVYDCMYIRALRVHDQRSAHNSNAQIIGRSTMKQFRSTELYLLISIGNLNHIIGKMRALLKLSYGGGA